MSSAAPFRSSALQVASQRWKAPLLGLLTAAVLAGCGSSVKLNDDPAAAANAALGAADLATGGAAGAAGIGNVNGAALGGMGGGANVAGVQADGAGALGQAPADLGRVLYFDYDDFSVRAEFAPLMVSHARVLNNDRQRRIALEGHTDDRGGREYNLALGQKRADAVRRSLALLGVTEDQMEAVSFGEEKPASAGSDENAYSLNRRVELTYR